MAEKKNYESTVMRMAGNIASGLARDHELFKVQPESSPASFAERIETISRQSVCLARAIVAEVQRTEPVAALDRSQEAVKP